MEPKATLNVAFGHCKRLRFRKQRACPSGPGAVIASPELARADEGAISLCRLLQPSSARGCRRVSSGLLSNVEKLVPMIIDVMIYRFTEIVEITANRLLAVLTLKAAIGVDVDYVINRV